MTDQQTERTSRWWPPSHRAVTLIVVTPLTLFGVLAGLAAVLLLFYGGTVIATNTLSGESSVVTPAMGALPFGILALAMLGMAAFVYYDREVANAR